MRRHCITFLISDKSTLLNRLKINSFQIMEEPIPSSYIRYARTNLYAKQSNSLPP